MLRTMLKMMLHPGLIVPRALRAYRRRVSRVNAGGRTYYEYKGALYPGYLNKGDAAAWVAGVASAYCRGKGLDIGAGKWPLKGAIPVQDTPGENAYRLDRFKDGSLDFVFSSHCLEHLERWPEALRLWTSKLKPGGTLFLYLPHESMLLWRPGAPWVNDAHKWIPTPEAVCAMLATLGLTVVSRSDGPDAYWSFFVAARKPGGDVLCR